MNQVLRDLHRRGERSIPEHIVLAFELGDAVPACLADPGRVRNVIQNLVVNARDAMPDGGRLTLETMATALSDREAIRAGIGEGRYGALRDGDAGVGLTADVARLAFEPFFTTDEITLLPKPFDEPELAACIRGALPTPPQPRPRSGS